MLRSASQSQAKPKSRTVVHSMHALGPAPFRPSFKPLEKRDMLHERKPPQPAHPLRRPSYWRSACCLLAVMLPQILPRHHTMPVAPGPLTDR